METSPETTATPNTRSFTTVEYVKDLIIVALVVAAVAFTLGRWSAPDATTQPESKQPSGASYSKQYKPSTPSTSGSYKSYDKPSTSGSNGSSKYSKVETAYFNCFNAKYNDWEHNTSC